MPRAMQLMRLAGTNPIPAPTAQRVRTFLVGVRRRLVPSADGFQSTDFALHEYLGLMALAVGID
jgi:uncharacterized SAM-binding protein YcdF (DUF218 family)